MALTDSDIAAIRGSLRELASASERAVRSIATSPVTEDATAYGHAVDVADLFGNHDLFTAAHTSVHVMILTAADHAKTFVSAVKRPGTTTSTAVLTRGAVEALAKCHYLLTASDARTLLQRYVALQEYEFKRMENSDFQDAGGTLVNAAEHVATLRESLINATVPPLSLRQHAVNLSTMVRDLLDASAELDSGLGRKLYSQLSSIAHANTSAILMYLQESDDGPRLWMPRELVLEQAGMCIGTLQTVVNEYLRYHKPTAAVVERWDQALVRAGQPLHQLQATMSSPNDPQAPVARKAR